MSTVIFCV